MGLGAGQIALDVDFAAMAASSSAKPLVRLVASGTQSLADNTAVAVTFTGAEDIDTDGYHSTGVNPTRITPLKAGIYRAKGSVPIASRSDYTTLNVWIRQNGVTNLAPADRLGPPALSQINQLGTDCLVTCDGVTDYIEVMVQQDNVANVAVLTNQANQYSAVFELEYLRPS